jgi:hypothetical protein
VELHGFLRNIGGQESDSENAYTEIERLKRQTLSVPIKFTRGANEAQARRANNRTKAQMNRHLLHRSGPERATFSHPKVIPKGSQHAWRCSVKVIQSCTS